MARIQTREDKTREDKEDNMRLKIRSTLATVALLLIASAAWAKTNTDYDHKVNFAAFKTYSWGKVQTANSLWNQRVKDAVDSQLAAKGWRQVPSGGDVIVNAFEKTKPEQTINTFYDGFGGGGGRRFGGFGGFGGFGDATTTVDTYKVGTLVVDMMAANSNNLIWRGAASDTLSSNADKQTKKLNSEVEKLFKHFPPESK
jgi:Domain of unknown function (DUF4136)